MEATERAGAFSRRGGQIGDVEADHLRSRAGGLPRASGTSARSGTSPSHRPSACSLRPQIAHNPARSLPAGPARRSPPDERGRWARRGQRSRLHQEDRDVPAVLKAISRGGRHGREHTPCASDNAILLDMKNRSNRGGKHGEVWSKAPRWLLWRHGKSAASPRRRPIFIPPFRVGSRLPPLKPLIRRRSDRCCAGASAAGPGAGCRSQPLLRDRLALMAAETCVSMTGRREDQASLRDVAHLTRPGDHPVPRA